MSTPLLHRFCTRLAMTLAVLALGAYACADTAAQQINVLVRLMPESSRVAVEGSCPANTSWSFRDSFAGVVGLGQRIEQFAALDESGQEIATRKLAPGQFESAQAAAHIRYEVNLTPQFSGSDSARVSWLKEQRGLFMLADLLPVLTSNRPRDAGAVVQFKMPDGWVVYPQEKKDSQIGPFVGEIDRLVFAAGSHLRASTLNESGMTFTLITDGEWAFTDADLRELAGRVLQAHRDVFGAMPAKQGTLILFPFPGAALATQWSAETRGATVTLLMGKVPSKVGALAQISTPLTHEFLHLWVPNALNLEGDYDWFYEGFTVYQAARTAVRLNLLTFAEFLNAIARAHEASNTSSLSLIEASGRRWTTGQPAVYSKSLVVAFLYDLRMRAASRGKKSLADVYRTILQKYSNRAAGGFDGNEAATRALALDAAGEDFVRQFIRSPVTIDLAKELAQFGLVVETVGLRTHIGVSEKLTKPQRDLLRELGYNDTVRSPRH